VWDAVCGSGPGRRAINRQPISARSALGRRGGAKLLLARAEAINEHRLATLDQRALDAVLIASTQPRWLTIRAVRPGAIVVAHPRGA